MKKGYLKLIADATGFVPDMVYAVKVGRRKNAKIEELIRIATKTPTDFPEAIRKAKAERDAFRRAKEVLLELEY